MEMKFKVSPKKPVNKVIAWLCSWGYLVFACLMIAQFGTASYYRLIEVIKHGFDFSILVGLDLVLLALEAVIGVFLIFCVNFFEWFLNPTLEDCGDYIVFKTDDVIAVLGKATTVNTINSITSIRIKRNSIIVNGDITVREPMQKNKSSNTCEIVGLYDSEDKQKVEEILRKHMKTNQS